MLRRYLIPVLLLLSIGPVEAGEELDQRLHRLFATSAFETKRFGPARWLRGGTSYTTVENAPGSNGAQDIVAYVRGNNLYVEELATGKIVAPTRGWCRLGSRGHRRFVTWRRC